MNTSLLSKCILDLYYARERLTKRNEACLNLTVRDQPLGRRDNIKKVRNPELVETHACYLVEMHACYLAKKRVLDRSILKCFY